MSENTRDYLGFLFRCIGGGCVFVSVAGVVGNNFFPLGLITLVLSLGFLFGSRWIEQGGQK